MVSWGLITVASSKRLVDVKLGMEAFPFPDQAHETFDAKTHACR